ncbi:unnamed protein product [Penicillium discolor]
MPSSVVFLAATPATGARSTCTVTKENTLSSSDTLRRHVRQRHGIIEPLKRAQRACKSCHAGKSRCEGGVPCDECLRRKVECSFNDPAGTVENQSPGSETHRVSSMKHDQPQLQNTEKKEEHYIRLYFGIFHPSWPFIHKGSFDIRRETPFLVQSMIVIGLWVTREPSAQSAAVELHGKLDLALRDQRVRATNNIPHTMCWLY